MSWKLVALLESSLCVLESVLAMILLGFVMTATGGTDATRPIAIIGLGVAVALVLVAHGQLIGSFRRVPDDSTAARPSGPALPILAVLLFAGSASLVLLAPRADWAGFARAFLVYAMAPPTLLALVARGLLVLATRHPSSRSLN